MDATLPEDAALRSAPRVIVGVIRRDFYRARGLESAEAARSDDSIVADLERFHYVRLNAERKVPRGERSRVVFLVLAAKGKYAHYSPDLRHLLEGVEAERPKGAKGLDEVFVVAETEFFGKKNLTEVVADFQERASAARKDSVDSAGAAPFYSAYPYHVFSLVVPEHESVPPHRIMSADEVAALLHGERITRSDLPAILANDPPVVWAGGREGQVVEITRASQTAGTSVYYRRIERGTTR